MITPRGLSLASRFRGGHGGPPSIPALLITLLLALDFAANAGASDTSTTASTVHLRDVRMRDACVLVDESTRTYIMIASARGARVRAYTSKNLIDWEGPRTIFEATPGTWEGADIRAIWAPEMHAYRGRYYLFLTFDTTTPFPEQWRNWRPRVKRASTVLVGDSPFGPFKPFASRPTLPEDMMTLDGTLWIEDGVPWMVYCHEWVQIVNGTVEMIRLTDDLSATVGEPVRLFWGNDGPWTKRSEQYGCWVTDAPWLFRSQSGKLFMTWSSGSPTGYAVGLAISETGKLAGPWRHQAEPVFKDDGGHAMFFRAFDGRLVMVLHQPNKTPDERIHLFVMEDTGETLRVGHEIAP